MFLDRILRYILKKRSNSNTFLFTLGYEGLKTDDLISHLKQKNVEILVDVREIPWSRKRGFSKSQLEAILQKHGIRYVHMKKLGSPSAIRKRVKEESNYDYFFNAYKNYVATQIDELKNLQRMTEKAVCCLMCYERNVEMCHRKIIASEVKRIDNNGLKVVHL